MLGGFFAASETAIDSALVEEGPFERFRTVDAKGLTEVSLATLGEIMAIDAYDALVDRIADAPQAESGHAGLLRLPDEFRDALATSIDLVPTAQRWAATDELAADGWQASDASDALHEIAQLAREAQNEGQQLLYWWSL